MRNETTGLFKELVATNNETVSITPGAATQVGTFQISSMPPTTAGRRNYLEHVHVGLTVTLDPDAGGGPVRHDQLFKAASNFTLRSPFFGDYYTEQQSRGAVLGLITDVVANGYMMDSPARIEVPANTDSDVTIDVTWTLPFAHEVLEKPSELTQWLGFFEGGIQQTVIAAESVYGTEYPGAVIKAPTTLRAYVEYRPDRDNWIGVPFQWRERQVVNGGNQPILTNMGGETNLHGIQPGAGVPWMCWLGNPTAMGLDGPSNVDNVVSVEVPWRGQMALRNIDGYFKSLRRAMGKRVGPISGLGATIAHDNSGWPNTQATVHNGRPSANAQALFLPFIHPGKDFKTSKAQRLIGNLPFNFTFTTPVTGTHRFVTWELLEFSPDHLQRLQDAAGWSGLTRFRADLGSGGRIADEGDLRYTRWLFA